MGDFQLSKSTKCIYVKDVRSLDQEVVFSLNFSHTNTVAMSQTHIQFTVSANIHTTMYSTIKVKLKNPSSKYWNTKQNNCKERERERERVMCVCFAPLFTVFHVLFIELNWLCIFDDIVHSGFFPFNFIPTIQCITMYGICRVA